MVHHGDTNDCGVPSFEGLAILSGAEENIYLEDLVNELSGSSNGPQLPQPSAPPRSKRMDGSGMKKGDLFDSKAAYNHKVRHSAILNNFNIHTGRSTTTTLEFKCRDEKCEWRAVASKKKEASFFELRKYNPEHSCSLLTQDMKNPACTSKFIASCMKDRFADNLLEAPRASDVIAYAQKELHVPVSKWKSYDVRVKAFEEVCGTPEENYGDLPAYLYMIQANNPGTAVEIKVGDDGRFLYCFIALGATIRGYRYMRPVICIDATFLKTNHKGQLIAVVAHDSDKHIFVVAWGIVNTESTESWTWFLRRLKINAVPETDELVIVSDRNQGIKNAVKEVYPNAFHGICYKHLQQNLVKHYPRGGWGKFFYLAAYAYTESDFNKYFWEMQVMCPDVWAPRIRRYASTSLPKYEKNNGRGPTVLDAGTRR